MTRLTVTFAALALAGCTSEIDPTTAHEDHGHDLVVELAAPDDVAREAAQPFARLGLLYEAPAGTPLEVSTSTDGHEWSPWAAAVFAADADDAESAIRVADHDVGGEEARFYRVRSVPGAAIPAAISFAFYSTADLAAMTEDTEDLIGPDSLANDDPEVAGAVEASGDWRTFRFDQGRVTGSWLWLLRKARSKGWGGRLYGPRTGLRTYRQQKELWDAYQGGWGAPAFPPWGPSRHMLRNVRRVGKWYQAVDTNDVGRLISIARGLGVSLRVPYLGEPWHVEASRPFRAPARWNP